ncbi:PIR protein [Plasmodium ovale]|uniref:PIR Superfamily Protein n=2 Tax=Plasmodium ovale TaxID=36330 RepID=A0A1A8X769_PLAOA|nr:PIR Superfamily Protein [Plasmodium ovale curtisi]SBT83307.1 PIR protein [Plasmodium ovale]
MENRVKILKEELEAFKINLLLNNSVGLCEYCSSCDVAHEQVRNTPWFKFFCYQFARNVKYVYDTIHLKGSLKKERCNTLMHWIHDKVSKFYNKLSIKPQNVDIITELLKVWREIHSKISNETSICELPIKENIKSLDEMERKKIMSDYCEDYSELRSLLTKPYTTNCNIYYDYFKESFLEFRKIAEVHNAECLEISNCWRFCKNYDPDDILKKSKCEVIEILKEKKEYIKKDECDALTQQAVSEVKIEPKELPNPEFTFSDNRAIILILFSLWGIFLTFLFLYKMMPFRSWINSKIGKKKIIRDSFNDQSDDEILDVDYENLDRNMQNTGYNITYNSDWNSSR